MKVKMGAGYRGAVNVDGRQVETKQYYDGHHLLVDDIGVVKALVQQHNVPMLDVVDDGDKADFAIINFRHHMTPDKTFEFFNATLNQGYQYIAQERCRALFARGRATA